MTEIDIPCRLVIVDGREIELSRSAFDTVLLLSSRPGVVRTRGEILDMLGNYSSDVRAVDTIIKRIRRAGIPNIRTRYDVGYAWKA